MIISMSNIIKIMIGFNIADCLLPWTLFFDLAYVRSTVRTGPGPTGPGPGPTGLGPTGPGPGPNWPGSRLGSRVPLGPGPGSHPGPENKVGPPINTPY